MASKRAKRNKVAEEASSLNATPGQFSAALNENMLKLDELADNDLVSWLANKLDEKLAQKRQEGRSAWWSSKLANTDEIRESAMKHFADGNDMGGVVLMAMYLRRKEAGI